MSTPSEPALTTAVEFSCDSGESKPSTIAADNVGEEQHDVLKSGFTVEQDTSGDDSLQGALDAKIPSEDYPAVTSDEFSDTTNVVPSADLPVPEIVASPQGAGDSEVWIPKGPPLKPDASQVGPQQGPKRPKPKRDN